MFTAFTYDIETKQVVYAICNVHYQPLCLTTSILDAIQFIQKK